MDSILLTIKRMMGGIVVDERELLDEDIVISDFESFDLELLVHINSAFAELTQLGVGPKEGFFVSDKNTTWYDFIPDDVLLSMVKNYIYLKVKVAFDPPTSSSVLESYKQMIAELEWRLNGLFDICGNVEL